MFKSKLAIAAVILVASSATASAAMNCNKQYQDFWDKVTQEGASLSGSVLAEINRRGLRAFDACQAGDEQSAESFFQKLREDGAAKDYFEKLREDGAAKK